MPIPNWTDFWKSFPDSFWQLASVTMWTENMDMLGDDWTISQSPTNVLAWLITASECRAFTTDWVDASLEILTKIKEEKIDL